MKTMLMVGLMTVLGFAGLAAGPQPQQPGPGARPPQGAPNAPRMGQQPQSGAPRMGQPAAEGRRGTNVRRARPGRRSGERMTEADRKLEYISQLEEKGRRAASQIAAYIVDGNEEVSEAAYTAWASIVEQMDYELRARAILEAAEAIRQVSQPVR